MQYRTNEFNQLPQFIDYSNLMSPEQQFYQNHVNLALTQHTVISSHFECHQTSTIHQEFVPQIVSSFMLAFSIRLAVS